MRFIAKSPSAARPAIPARAARTSTILPLRGFGARIRHSLRLVTLCRVFWGFLPSGPGYQEIGPSRSRQGLSFDPAPGRDPGMVPGQENLGDRPAFELLRAGILRVFQKPVGK